MAVVLRPDGVLVATLDVVGEGNEVDGVLVDADDLAQWEGDFGLNGNSDADGDSDSDGADFLVWQRNIAPVAASAIGMEVSPRPLAASIVHSQDIPAGALVPGALGSFEALCKNAG